MKYRSKRKMCTQTIEIPKRILRHNGSWRSRAAQLFNWRPDYPPKTVFRWCTTVAVGSWKKLSPEGGGEVNNRAQLRNRHGGPTPRLVGCPAPRNSINLNQQQIEKFQLIPFEWGVCKDMMTLLHMWTFRKWQAIVLNAQFFLFLKMFNEKTRLDNLHNS